MKTLTIKSICILIISILCFSMVSCGSNNKDDLWKDATYTEDVEIGNGSKTITVKVTAEERSVTFTIHTDKDTLGEALVENSIVSGEQGAYGLYVKSVNGIFADYNTTKSYWAVNKDDKAVLTGVDAVEITDGDNFEMIYTKS